MENREAIKIINQYDMNFHWNDGEPIPAEQLAEAFDLAISALERQVQDRWIPVTERLPEKDCECRVTEGDFKSVFDCHWNNHKKQFEVWSHYQDDYLPITNATAWKPIEEPYTEEKA